MPNDLLERDIELVALREAAARAEGGDGQLVLVVGDAGIGKTRILGVARGWAAESGFTVLSARGGELETAFAFGVVRQLFEALLAAAPERHEEWLAGAATLARPLFDAHGTAEPSSSGSSFAMLHGLYWLAANVALGNPTLVIVDDVHWCDEPSLRWLNYLARRLEGLPILLAIATRPPEQAVHVELVNALLAEPSAALLTLSGLGEASAAAIAEQRLGRASDAAFAAALHDGSGGNPLFLMALLDAVERLHVPLTADNAARVLSLAPEAVARGVASRLAQLPPEAGEMLRAAAILGDGTRLSLATVLTSLDATGALTAASSLVRAGLVSSEDPIEFRHPVVRTAVLAHMRASDRLGGYRRAAEVLLERGAPITHAAAYLLETLPDGDAFVVRTLRAAAARSITEGASDSAIRYLERALLEPPSAEERPDLLHELGIAELNTGVSGAADRLRASVAALEDPGLRPDLTLSYARSLILLGEMGRALALLTEARTLSETERAQLSGHLLMAAQHDPEQRALAVEIASAASGAGDALMHAALASELAREGAARGETLDHVSRALTTISDADPDAVLATMHALFPQMVAGEEVAAIEGYTAAIAAAHRRGDLFALQILGVFRGAALYRAGDLLAAEEDLRPPSDPGRSGGGSFQVYRAAFLAQVLLERADVDAAREVLVGPFSLDAPVSRVFTLDASGSVALQLGRTAEALADFLATGENAEAIGIANPAWSPWRSQAALACWRLGRPGDAAELAAEEVRRARRWGAPRAIGIALRARGLVTGDAAGIDELREAASVLEGSAARLEHARVLIDLGAMLRRTNQRKEARARLREGIDAAHVCGGTALVSRANEELAATGARPRSLMVTGRDTLTASERRVARLALADMSNKEIAQTLFVTVKTVEVHLSRVYRKLDITSRRQLHEGLLAEPG